MPWGNFGNLIDLTPLLAILAAGFAVGVLAALIFTCFKR